MGMLKQESITKLKQRHETCQQVFWSLLVVCLTIMLPAGEAMAQGANPLANTVCRVVTALQGDIARGVAAVGVIFLGFGLFMGKVTWGVALALGIGIGAVFGAADIVTLLGSNEAGNGCIT